MIVIAQGPSDLLQQGERLFFSHALPDHHLKRRPVTPRLGHPLRPYGDFDGTGHEILGGLRIFWVELYSQAESENLMLRQGDLTGDRGMVVLVACGGPSTFYQKQIQTAIGPIEFGLLAGGSVRVDVEVSEVAGDLLYLTPDHFQFGSPPHSLHEWAAAVRLGF